MRYDGTCEEYTIVAAYSDDPVVMAGKEKADISDKIEDLRRQRWSFASLVLKNNSPKIIITNEKKFEFSCEQEVAQMKQLAEFTAIFNQLNPLFDEIKTKYPRLKAPALHELKALRSESAQKIVTYINRIKNETVYKMGIQSKTKTLDDVLADPQLKQMKSEYEGYINAEEARLKDLDMYIAKINEILEGE